MKNPSSTEPKWLVNHWNIFKDVLNRADFQAEIEAIRQERAANPYIAPLPLGEIYTSLFDKHLIPWSCMLAVDYLIGHPEATDAELKSRLNSPIRWISHRLQEAGPSANPAEEYRAITYFREKPSSSGVFLEVMPHTKLSEVRDFLDINSSELNRVLKDSSSPATWLFPKRLSRRVDKPNELMEDVYELHREGKNAPEIRRELGIEDRIDDSNIRKLIATAKKKRNNA